MLRPRVASSVRSIGDRPVLRRAAIKDTARRRREIQRFLPWIGVIGAVACVVSVPILVATRPTVAASVVAFDVTLAVLFLALAVIARWTARRNVWLVFQGMAWLGLAAAIITAVGTGLEAEIARLNIVILPMVLALLSRWRVRDQLLWCAVAWLIVVVASVWADPGTVPGGTVSWTAVIIGFSYGSMFGIGGTHLFTRARTLTAVRELEAQAATRAAHAARATAAAAEEQYRRIVQTTGEGIWVGDPQWQASFTNDHFLEMVGRDASTVAGMGLGDFIHPDDRPEVWARLAASEDAPGPTGDFRLLRADGTERWVSATASPTRSDHGARNGHLLMFTDAGDRHAAEQRLRELNATFRRLADVDALTGLLNRRSLDRDLETLAALDEPVAILLVDVDHFKRFNDEHGHQAGDDALRALGPILQGAVRASDRVYRYGGEEFLVLLVGVTEPVARQSAARIVDAVAAAGAATAIDSAWRLPTVSVGLATGTSGGVGGTAALIHAADLALYDAKAAGRNRSVTAPPADGAVRRIRVPLPDTPPATSAAPA